MTHSPSPSRSLRPWLAWIGLFLVVGLSIVQLPRLLSPAAWQFEDYVAHWSAARLHLTGGNPYSHEQIFALEQATGYPKPAPLIMWNPPWTLSILMPFGLLPFPVSRLVWLLFEVGLLLVSAEWTWRYYGGPAHQHWWAWVLTFAFYPTLLLIGLGQITFLPLVGVVGFLVLEKRGQDFWAGAALALAATKPHLVYLVFLAVLGWALIYRRWWVVLGGLAAGAAMTGLALACNPQVIDQYRYAVAHHPPDYMIAATVGSIARFACDQANFSIQFIPVLLGCVWLVTYGFLNRRHWAWGDCMPVLLFVSLMTAPYGWSYDLVLLLVPLIQAATWAAAAPRSRTAILALAWFVAVDGVVFLIYIVWYVEEHYYVWLAPVLFVGYLLARAQARRDGLLARSPSTAPPTAGAVSSAACRSSL